jgi:two-component system response regulator FixJ
VAVVDDDAAVCDSMQCLLEAYDLDVQTYQRGADFLKNQPEIACLITDYDLPDIDGLELISELRKRGSQVPMIMSTAATDPWIKRCAAEAGIKFVLEKPYSYEALLGAIREELLG